MLAFITLGFSERRLCARHWAKGLTLILLEDSLLASLLREEQLLSHFTDEHTEAREGRSLAQDLAGPVTDKAGI